MFWLILVLREKKYEAESQTTHPNAITARTMTAAYAVVFKFFMDWCNPIRNYST